jgi:pimeloyl-ACP methyl ester carboxylesterase
MEELKLQVQGLVLSALAFGPTDGAPLLALHGWTDNAATFENLAPQLPEYRFIALELPGHGWSDPRPPGQPYHFLDWVAVVFDAAEALGWKRFTLLGHSMGAGIASLAAGVFPDRIAQLILLDGLGPMAGAEGEIPERLARYLTTRTSLGRQKIYPDVEAATARLHAALPNLSAAALQALVLRGVKPTAQGVTWRSDPRLHEISAWRLTEPQILSFLKRISAPTLVIRPEQGYPFEEGVMRQRLDAIKHVEVRNVPGHHHVHLDQGELVASTILRWSAERSGGAVTGESQ